MDAEELKKRTKEFGLQVVKLAASLPSNRISDILVRQLIRSATSVGANYRSACRGRSKPDFISKTGIAIEEADESMYWMDLLVEASFVSEKLISPLIQEANELIAILTASVKTARVNLAKSK